MLGARQISLWCQHSVRISSKVFLKFTQFSLNRALGWFSYRIAMSVCLSVCLWRPSQNTYFWVSRRPLVKEHIPNIGLWLQKFLPPQKNKNNLPSYLCYRSYYPHRSRDSVSPVCGFSYFFVKLFHRRPILGICSLTRSLHNSRKWVFWAYARRGRVNQKQFRKKIMYFLCCVIAGQY